MAGIPKWRFRLNLFSGALYGITGVIACAVTK
jgi:hypothetical protein